MTTRIHGGIASPSQNLVGHQTYFTVAVTGATFASGDIGVPDSDLEKVVRLIQLRSTIVALSLASTTTLNVAVEGAGDAWFNSDIVTTLKATIEAAGFGTTTVTAGSFAVV